MLKVLRKRMKGIMITVAIVFAVSMLYGLGSTGFKGLGAQGAKSDNVNLAQVNGKEVHKFRFAQIVNRLISEAKTNVDPMQLLYLQTMALAQLVDFSIMQQDAERSFGANGDEISSAVNGIMTSNNIKGQKEFEQILKQQGFTFEDMKRMIKDEIAVQKMIAKIKGAQVVTPDDLREISVAHILFRTVGLDGKKQDEAKKNAEKVLVLAQSGQDFSALAKEYSQDPGTASKGGELGFFKKGQMVKEFDDAAYLLKPGQISKIVKTDYGFHIIKMNESRLIANPDQAKILAEKQKNAFDLWFAGLKKKANVKIENKMLSAFTLRMQGNVAGAVETLKQAVVDQPTNTYAHLFYAETLTAMGDFAKALSMFETASTLAGADPVIHLYLGKAYLGAVKTTSGATAEEFSKRSLQEYEKASILAGENKQVRLSLKKYFSDNGMKSLANQEDERIAKIEEKEKFEQELQKKMGTTPVAK